MSKQCSCGRVVEKYANSFHKLCLICNKIRLDKSRVVKNKTIPSSLNIIKPSLKEARKRPEKRVSMFAPNFSVTNKKKTVELDEIFYEECFNLSNHSCEECGTRLPDRFRDDNGKIIARFRYSHIIPKSTASELRHQVENINHLCMKCHHQWDFGDKKSMAIYESNRERFPNFLQ